MQSKFLSSTKILAQTFTRTFLNAKVAGLRYLVFYVSKDEDMRRPKKRWLLKLNWNGTDNFTPLFSGFFTLKPYCISPQTLKTSI